MRASSDEIGEDKTPEKRENIAERAVRRMLDAEGREATISGKTGEVIAIQAISYGTSFDSAAFHFGAGVLHGNG